jgi:hypothetical protein
MRFDLSRRGGDRTRGQAETMNTSSAGLLFAVLLVYP